MMKFGKLRTRATFSRGKFHGRHAATTAAPPKASTRPSVRSALDRTPNDPAARWRLFEHDSLF
jgi:hypothetical protein